MSDAFIAAANALTQLGSWIVNHKEVLGLLLVSSGAVSVVLEWVKRWAAVQSKVVISVLHYLIALIPVGANYIEGLHSSSYLVVFAQALIIMGTNQFVYPTVVKPLATIFDDAKAKAQVQKAKQLATEFQG